MGTRQHRFVDVILFLCCCLVVASVALVRIQRHRSHARATTCKTNLMQIGLAFHNYHSAYRRLPAGCGGTTAREGADESQHNASRLSVFVGLTPFVEKQALWERISNPLQVGSKTFPSMGPVPWYDPDVYKPWGMRPEWLACPTDKDSVKFSVASSYVVNCGDAVERVGYPSKQSNNEAMQIQRATNRGAHAGSKMLRFRDYLDGLSNTVFLSEKRIADPIAKGVDDLAFDPSRCVDAVTKQTAPFWQPGREACWADGCLRSTGFQTILPPNSASATSKQNELEGVVSASSHHADGVHVLFGDGAVRFATTSIDTGDTHAPTVAMLKDGKAYTPPGAQSPYGIWGAIGTRASAESLEFENDNLIEPPRELSPLERQEADKKPLQEWTSSAGTTIKARQIDLENESRVLLLTEAGKMQRIPLSQLKSEDAYRAVQQGLAVQLEARAKLKTDLENALRLLDEKKFADFAGQYIQGGDLDSESMGKLIQAERGLFIYRIETLLGMLNSPKAKRMSLPRDQSGRIGIDFSEMQMPPPPISSNVELMYSGNKWIFQPR